MNGNQGLTCLNLQSHGITLSSRVLPAVELAAEAIENEVGYRRLSGTVLAANYIYATMKRSSYAMPLSHVTRTRFSAKNETKAMFLVF